MKKLIINIFERIGNKYFAENKDIGREIRLGEILPALERGEQVILNFEKIESATQSFIHSLVSDVIRKYGESALDRVMFKSCSDDVQKIVSFVVDYMQDAIRKGKADF